MSNIKYYCLILFFSVFFTSCEKNDPSVIDPTPSFPRILNSYIVPPTFNSDTINAVVVAVVSSDIPVSNVKADLFDENNTLITSVNLLDNGVLPDTTAGDGHFTGVLNKIFSCRLVGTYRVQIIAYNVSQYASNTVNQNLNVIRNPHHPPVISNIVAYPDSAQEFAFINLGFMVTAFDPDGQCDIKRVFYTGFKPDNAALTPEDLFDDGSCCPINGGPPSGDTTANDMKFTRIFLGGQANQLGNYRYFIKAVNRSGDTSNVLTHTIYVHP